MLELALPQGELTMWYISLGIGAVVIVVVIALLTLLLKLVKEIDDGVFAVWEMAKRLAANTATTWQLNRTALVLEQVKAEALRHDELLGSKL